MFSWFKNVTLKSGGAGSEAWNRVCMIAPVKKFGRARLSTDLLVAEFAKFVKVKSTDGHQNRVPSGQSALCSRVCITTLFSFLPLFFSPLSVYIYRQLKLHHISVISLVRARTVYSCDATRQLSSKESVGSANECLVFSKEFTR